MWDPLALDRQRVEEALLRRQVETRHYGPDHSGMGPHRSPARRRGWIGKRRDR